MIHALFGWTARAMGIAGLALSLAGCVVETETYLSEPGGEPLDQRLVGAWQLIDGEAGSFGVLLIREGDEGVLDMLTLEAENDEESGRQSHKWASSQAWTTVIDGDGYANLDFEGDRMIAAYRFLDDGDFAVGLMDLDLFRAAIEENRLDGTVVEGTFGNTVTVTAGAAALKTFLSQNGGHALFDFGDADAQIIFEPYRFETR
jgi:hypothetical protein